MNNLTSKLIEVLSEIDNVPKSGYNNFHKYKYVTEDDLVTAVRDKLAKRGVFVFTSSESQELQELSDGKLITKVETLHTFVDSESGETATVKSQGQGEDKGDKGVYKAITGALKYMLYKNFLIPTGDDPERDSKKMDSSTRKRPTVRKKVVRKQ